VKTFYNNNFRSFDWTKSFVESMWGWKCVFGRQASTKYLVTFFFFFLLDVKNMRCCHWVSWCSFCTHLRAQITEMVIQHLCLHNL